MEKAGALRLSTICFNFIFITIYKTEMGLEDLDRKGDGSVIGKEIKSIVFMGI
jgi:hypothetical protein